MRTHIHGRVGLLCGNNSVRAMVNSASCIPCNRVLDELFDLLQDHHHSQSKGTSEALWEWCEKHLGALTQEEAHARAQRQHNEEELI